MNTQAKNEATLVDFYRAFSQRDAGRMVACYHADATFQDPVFGRLTRRELETMWRMLCERGEDLKITLERHTATATTGHAEWVASYTFNTTGRFVRNSVSSEFRFQDGLIIEQEDTFDLWSWAGMALGASGKLLGWNSSFQRTVRGKARKSLERYAHTSTAKAAL